MHSQSPLLTLPSLPTLTETSDWLTLLCDVADSVGGSLVGGSLVGGSLVGGSLVGDSLVGGCDGSELGMGMTESPGLPDVSDGVGEVDGVTTLDGTSVDDVTVAESELGWPDGGVAALLSGVDVGDVLRADGPTLLGGGVDG